MKTLKNMKGEKRIQEKKKIAFFHVMEKTGDRAHFTKSSKSIQDRGEK